MPLLPEHGLPLSMLGWFATNVASPERAMRSLLHAALWLRCLFVVLDGAAAPASSCECRSVAASPARLRHTHMQWARREQSKCLMHSSLNPIPVKCHCLFPCGACVAFEGRFLGSATSSFAHRGCALHGCCFLVWSVIAFAHGASSHVHVIVSLLLRTAHLLQCMCVVFSCKVPPPLCMAPLCHECSHGLCPLPSETISKETGWS